VAVAGREGLRALNVFQLILFRSLPHVRDMLEAWRSDYNINRPHSRLAWLSPATYVAAKRSAALH